IFVMAIGMMALLVMFPIGALEMAQAIQDDRAASVSVNANAIAEARNIRQDALVAGAYTDPNPPGPPVVPPITNGEEPSFPVYIDPNGVITGTGSPTQTDKWLGGVQGLIPRRTVSFVGTTQRLAYRWFNSLDDIYFSLDDTTAGSTPLGWPNITVASPPAPVPQFDRDTDAYSFAYMCQRP